MGQGRQRGKRNHPLLHGKAKVVTGVLHMSNVLCTSSFSSYFFCHQSVWLFPLLCYVNRLALYWVYLFLVRLCCRIQVKTLHVVGHLASETLPFDFEYMKIMYMNFGLRNEYESGLWINEHYSSSSENEAWKKIDSSLHGFITNQQNNQLLIGLLAQLVEHWTGIAEVIGSNPIQGWIFFSALFLLLLK